MQVLVGCGHVRFLVSASTPYQLHIGSIGSIGSIRLPHPYDRRIVAAACGVPSTLRLLFRRYFVVVSASGRRRLSRLLWSRFYLLFLLAFAHLHFVRRSRSGKPAHDPLILVEVYSARWIIRFSQMTAVRSQNVR
jgi:hypothetical protein